MVECKYSNDDVFDFSRILDYCVHLALHCTSLVMLCCVGMEMIYVARGRWELALRRLEDAESLVRIYLFISFIITKLLRKLIFILNTCDSE